MVAFRSFLLVACLALSGCTWFSQATGGRAKATVSYRCGPFVLNSQTAQIDLGILLDDQIRQRIREGKDWRSEDQKPRLDIQGMILSYEVLPISIRKEGRPSIVRLRVSAQIKVIDHEEGNVTAEKLFSNSADIPAVANFAEKEDSLCQAITRRMSEDVFRDLLSQW